MREAFLETVEYINKKLADIPAHPDSMQQARIISLDTASDKLFKYHQGVFAPPTYNNQSTHDNEKTWLAHIVHALIKKGVLFEVVQA